MQSFFFNYKIDKRELKRLLLWFVHSYGCAKTTRFADTLKYVGFHYAMRAGISIGLDDLHIPAEKYQLVTNAQQDLRATTILAHRGEVTAAEKFRKVIDMWAWTSEHVKNEVIQHFECNTPNNPVYMMAFSGARGNVSQVRQLVGIRGLMADQKGDLIDMPIRTNFREGLTIVEYIISCYGSRKGVVDTALRTANSGYLTRRLVEVAQETSIYAVTCMSRQSIPLTALRDKETGNDLLSLETRLLGRVLAHTVYDPDSTAVRPIDRALAIRNTDMTPTLARSLGSRFKCIHIRSPFTCESTSKDICQFCYGWGLQGTDLVPLGEAVGVVAAQSIGEPGTQLTMRTFHTGGVFSGSVREKLVSPHAGIVSFSMESVQTLRTQTGDLCILTQEPMQMAIAGHSITVFQFPPKSIIYVIPGQHISALHVVGELVPILHRVVKSSKEDLTDLPIRSERSGQVYFDEVETITYSRKKQKENLYAYKYGCVWVIGGELLYTPLAFYQGDLISRHVGEIAHEHRSVDLYNEVELRIAPALFLARQNYIYTYLTSFPQVHVGDFIRVGQQITKNQVTTTGGLVIQLQRLSHGWILCVRDVIAYATGRTAALDVENEDIVHAGDRLFTFYYKREKTGDIVQGLPKIEQLFEARLKKGNTKLTHNPKKILFLYFFYLRIRHLNINHATLVSMLATQCYILNAVQRVYQSQGVDIADKHLEVIVREMCTLVCIVHPGHTPFMHGEIINHHYLRNYNTVEPYPAHYVPLVFGLTKLGLNNESFLSAASFQYTRKVLMLSALHGSYDKLTTIKHAILVGKLMPLGPANFYVRRAYMMSIAPNLKPRPLHLLPSVYRRLENTAKYLNS